jgi:hypothetical protein
MTDNKRSAAAYAAAWLFTLLGGYHTARAAYDNLTLASMFSSQGFMLGLAGSKLPVELPPLARFAAANIRLMFLLYFFVSLGVFMTGIGLLLRKAWALAAARRFFYSVSAVLFAIFLVPGLLVPKPLIFDGVAVSPEFNAAVGWMKVQLRLATALLGSVFFWAALWCGRPGIKGEFGPR